MTTLTADLMPAPHRAIGAIALNTFREAVRDRVLYLLLSFAIVVIAASRLLSMMTVGSEDKIIKDLGLSAISFFGVLTAVFVGVSLVFKEVERRTVYTLLANPVRRWQFVCGKYFGLMLLLAVEVAVMGATLGLVMVLRGQPALALLPAIALILIQLAVVTAFALLLSSLTNPIISALGTGAVWVLGHLVWSLEMLKERLGGGAAGVVCDALYWLLPNLGLLDIKAQVVNGVALDSVAVAWSAGYGLAYAAAVVMLACLAFGRREFGR